MASLPADSRLGLPHIDAGTYKTDLTTLPQVAGLFVFMDIVGISACQTG